MHKHIPLVIGNWKMNPATKVEAKTLYQAVKKTVSKQTGVQVVVAPPFPFLGECGGVRPAHLALGAQTLSSADGGAFTGEVSARQLESYDVTYVIIGHSERRAMGETDADVLAKVQTALKRKLTAVVCIGELTRDNDGQFYSVVGQQIRTLTSALSGAEMKKVVLAYEPIWAIGTGKTATVDDVKEMQLFIHSVLTKAYDRAVASKVTILYGGSVKPNNAMELYQGGGMQGFLVGGASLDPVDFGMIIKSVTN